MAASLNIPDYGQVNDLVNKYAKSYWKKSALKVRDYVFQDLDDVMQSCWVILIERKQARRLLEKEELEDNDKATLTTIMKRGLVDYIRTHVGRYYEGKDTNKSTFMFTTYYMDYTADETSDIVDFAFQDQSPMAKVEDVVIQKSLQEQLDSFLSNRIKPRELQIYDLVSKEGRTMKEVGRSFYITESRVSQICEKVRKKIDKDFGGKIRRNERSLGIW
jgi:RNA polymerase sigma factor (sigma-70 family)